MNGYCPGPPDAVNEGVGIRRCIAPPGDMLVGPERAPSAWSRGSVNNRSTNILTPWRIAVKISAC